MAIGTPVDLGHSTQLTSTTIAMTTGAAVVAGDAILVPFGNTAGTLATSGASCVDTAGNVYGVKQFTGGTLVTGAFYCANALAMLSGGTITITMPSSISRQGMTAMKVSGMRLDTATLYDTAYIPASGVSANGTGTSGTKTYSGQAQIEELLVEVWGGGASTFGTFTPTTGFTAIGGNAATSTLLPAYKITSVGNAPTINASWVNSIAYRGILFAFRGAVAANTARPIGLLTGVGL